MTAGQSELQIADWLKKNYWARDPNNNTPCAPIGVYLQTNPYELLARREIRNARQLARTLEW